MFIKNNDENNTATTRVTFFTLFFFVKSLRSLAHFNYVNFNQAALRAVLKPQNMSSSSQATQISVSFVCVYASSTLPFIAFFQSFHSLFGSLFQSISIDYETQEISYCPQKLFDLSFEYFIFDPISVSLF